MHESQQVSAVNLYRARPPLHRPVARAEPINVPPGLVDEPEGFLLLLL